MIGKIIEFFKSLFREKSQERTWLEKKLEKQEKKLKEIDNEEPNIDDVIDRINR